MDNREPPAPTFNRVLLFAVMNEKSTTHECIAESNLVSVLSEHLFFSFFFILMFLSLHNVVATLFIFDFLYFLFSLCSLSVLSLFFGHVALGFWGFK